MQMELTLEFAKNRIVALRKYIETIYDRDMDNGRKYLLYRSSFQLLQYWRRQFRILRFQQVGRSTPAPVNRYLVCCECKTSSFINVVSENQKKSVDFCILCQKITIPTVFIPGPPNA